MEIQRCPECGQRLETNYCDICMKKVPFRGQKIKRRADPWDTSSAHRSEKDHECVSFDMEQPKAKPVKKVTFPPKKTAVKPQKAKTVAIVVAVLALLPTFFGILEEVTDELTVAAPEPEYNYEAFAVGEVPQITPMTLYNDGEIQVSVGSAGTYYGEYALSVMAQNDSDRDVIVSTDLLSVNGYMVDCSLYADVPARESQQAFLQLDSYALEPAGITDIAEISFYLDIYDSQTYEDIAVTELITLETDIADGFTQTVDDSGWEMHPDDSLRIVYRGATVSSYGECDLQFYLENRSDEIVSVSTEGIWINGEEVPGFLWDILRPETRAVDSLCIYDLEELEITQLEQINEIYIEYMVEYYQGDQIVDTVYCSALFNPNALPTSD